MEMSVVDQVRKKFIVLVAAIGILQAIAFLIGDLLFPPVLTKDLVLNLGTALIMGILYLWVRKASDIKNVARALTLALMLILLYFTYTVANPFLAGLFFPIFPLFAFFLRGKKEGTVWLIFFLIVTAVYFLGAYLGLIKAPYLLSSGPLVPVVSFFLYILVTYFYVDIEEKSKQLLLCSPDFASS